MKRNQVPNRGLSLRLFLIAACCASLLGCVSLMQKSPSLGTESPASIFVSSESYGVEKVAILPFKEAPDSTQSTIGELFTAEMVQFGKYTLVDAEKVKEAIESLELDANNLTLPNAIELGHKMEVDGVVLGSVDRYGTVQVADQEYPVVAVSARLIECGTGKVAWSTELALRAQVATATLPEHALNVVHEMTRALFAQIGDLPAPVENGSGKKRIGTEYAAGTGETRISMDSVSAQVPVGFAVSNMGLREVVITWGLPPDEPHHYRIERTDTDVGTFSAIAEVNPRKCVYRDTGTRQALLADNTSYYYRMIAVSKNGLESPPTEVLKAVTAPPPDPPVSLQTEPPGSRAVQAKWEAPASEGVVRYIVERTEASDPGAFQKIAETAELDYLDGGTASSDLKDSTRYLYRVTSINRVGSIGEPSAPVEVMTFPPPEQVKNVVAVSDEVRCVPLSWAMSPEMDVVRYDIYRSAAEEGPYELLTSINGKKNTQHLDGGANPGNLDDEGTYYYKIRAINAVTSESEDSVAVHATTREAPPMVTSVTAISKCPRQVPVSWKVSPDVRVIGYEIWRAMGDEEDFVQIGRVAGRGTTNYLDRGGAKKGTDMGLLGDATIYRYKVVAYNTGNVRSSASEPAEAQTKFCPAAPVGITTTTNLPHAVNVFWSANSETDIVEYVVEAAFSPDEFTRLTSVPAVEGNNRVLARDPDLSDGIQRFYRIKALDKDSLESVWSEVVLGGAKPIPPAPINFSSEDVPAGVNLSWEPPAVPDIKEYKVWKKSFFSWDPVAVTDKPEYVIDQSLLAKSIVLAISTVDRDGLESLRSGPIQISARPKR